MTNDDDDDIIIAATIRGRQNKLVNMYPTQPFFYVNNDVISMRLHDWSTGGLLLVCPLVVSFA